MHIRRILSAKATNGDIPQDTGIWINGLDETLADRMAVAGLIEDRGAQQLGEFLDTYLKTRTSSKPNTLRNLEVGKRALIAFLGESKSIRKVTPAEADAFRQAMIAKGLGENSVRRRCGMARQFFNAAIRQRIIRENPFRDIKCNVRAMPDRFFYVTREMALKVLDACPNIQWKVIFALARFGGLRCPSEIQGLMWEDVDFGNSRIRVRSPKTEHHENGASRIIPLFPELEPLLLEAMAAAEPGTKHVVWQYQMENGNLRTGMERIIWRAGLKPWPKLFNNLRSSRQTELADTMPMHVVCRWMGNSKPVATEHYLQVTDEHFRKAVEKSGLKAIDGKGLQQKCAAFCAASDKKDKAAHFAAQQRAEANGNPLHVEGSEIDENADLVGAFSDSQDTAKICGNVGNARGGGRTLTPCGTGS